MNVREKFIVVLPPEDLDQHSHYLKAIAEGDENAFTWLYKNYSRRVYDYILLLTRNENLSEDVTQDTFLILWTNRKKLIEVPNFNGYTFRVAKNRLITHWRKQARLNHYIEEHLETMDGSALNDCLYKESEEMISKAISHLFPRQRQVYQLVRENGLSRKEVSGVMGIKPFTVKATMQAMMRRMKGVLGEGV